jgi:bacteriocin biosynthesis cyclodehydratase domain-containing protein
MARSLPRRPMLPRSYHVLFEPPELEGEEALVFASSLRRVRVKGRFFREFREEVIPYLDGSRAFDEIAALVAESFTREDLSEALYLLAENGVIIDAAELESVEDASRIEPQLSLFRSAVSNSVEAQKRLFSSTVAVFGLGSAGASAAIALAAAGVGEIRGFDPAVVQSADPYLAPFYACDDVGKPRTLALAQRLSAVSPSVRSKWFDKALVDDAVVRNAIIDCDFVVNCLDEGEISLAYKLNRVCHALGYRWISGGATGLEVKVGPLVVPGETACFMCYQMRLIASSQRPEEALRFHSYHDHRKHDDSSLHENLTCGPVVSGQLLALEVIKELSGILPSTLRGRLFIIDLADLSTSTHDILRKPWCPTCFESTVDAPNEAASVSN